MVYIIQLAAKQTVGVLEVADILELQYLLGILFSHKGFLHRAHGDLLLFVVVPYPARGHSCSPCLAEEMPFLQVYRGRDDNSKLRAGLIDQSRRMLLN